MFGALDEEATVRVLRGPEPDALGQQQMFQVTVLTGKHAGSTGWIGVGAIGRWYFDTKKPEQVIRDRNGNRICQGDALSSLILKAAGS